MKHYLARYFRAKKERDLLRGRIVREETRGKPGGTISETLRAQEDEAIKVMTDIIEVIGLLPAGDTGRAICQLRHLDCYNWTAIQREVHLARPSCYRYYRAALDTLLSIEAVQARVRAWRDSNQGDDAGRKG